MALLHAVRNYTQCLLVPYLIAVVRPGSPLHVAALHIKGEIFHVDVTGTSKDAVAQPYHLTCVRHDDVGVDDSRIVLRVGTGTRPEGKTQIW